MRITRNAVLVAMLSIAIVGMPSFASPAASPTAPLGIVLQAGNTKIGTDVRNNGATIYDGDRLQTDNDSSLRVRLGGPEMYLHPNTSALVHSLPNGFSADLADGTVVVSASAGQAFQVLADGVTVRPTGGQLTVGQVTRVSANELVLTSDRGTLEVSMGDEVRTVEAGHSYRLETEPEASSDPGPQGGPYHTARNRFIWIAIIGVSAATAIGVWRALVSQNQP